MIVERADLSDMEPVLTPYSRDQSQVQVLISDEFPVLMDSIISNSIRYSTGDVIISSHTYNLIVGGVVPVEFSFSLQGSLAVNLSIDARLLSKS